MNILAALRSQERALDDLTAVLKDLNTRLLALEDHVCSCCPPRARYYDTGFK